MSLPLLDRATEDGVTFALTPRHTPDLRPLRRTRGDARTGGGPPALLPARVPSAGEQFRFHVDMRRCIGCKCCVVACNEQNGNPAAITWRRVAEIEGGWYPHASRNYLSMGCNHCLEPTCLHGCPVDAYTKDPATGIVRHSADTCIGCQYCTWNCSYGVPQYNPERGVVGKCDMCHGRLALGQAPACVSACPEGAIQVEIVNLAEWRAATAVPTAGAPTGDHSLSTTRVTLPEPLAPNARPHDLTHVAPEHPHWPLVVMTVLTQLSVGAFSAIWFLHLAGAAAGLGAAALTSLVVGGLALGASTLHLGRPIHAWRALRMWRRSWLSREVLLFSAFAAVASTYAGLLWFAWPGGTLAGGATVLLGLGGVIASACIYRVPARPAWHTPYTLVQFLLTGGVLGPLFAAVAGAGEIGWLTASAALMAGAQLVVLALVFFRCNASDAPELRGTARLLSTVLASRLIWRSALLVTGAIVLPVLVMGMADEGVGLVGGTAGPLSFPGARHLLVAALALALAGEILGRYLFFVSVVPRHMAAPYVPDASEAA